MATEPPVTPADVMELEAWLAEHECAELWCDRPGCVAFAMVRAVLEIHAPRPVGVDETLDACTVCVDRDGGVFCEPCPTVSAMVRVMRGEGK